MLARREPRQKVLSLKVTEKFRRLVELLAAHLTLARGERHTLTDVMEESIRKLAEAEGVRVE